MSSGMVAEPPSTSKLELIREFLRLNGTQAEIDSGSFLHRHALPGGALVPLVPGPAPNPVPAMQAAIEALEAAYHPHRRVWQEEYEEHVNWEFTERELQALVNFLESDVGRHFLEGRWRMNAYVGTNTEPLVEQIVAAAQESLALGAHPTQK